MDDTHPLGYFPDEQTGEEPADSLAPGSAGVVQIQRKGGLFDAESDD